MTLGDPTREFVGAFINIDAETLGRWAEQRGIAYTTFTDLSQNERIRGLIRGEIEAVNRLMAPESRVRRFVNLPKELDPDEDELTRSRKLRRKHLEQKYSAFIDAIYSGAESSDATVPVRYQDGRAGVLNASVAVNDVGIGAVDEEGAVPARKGATHG